MGNLDSIVEKTEELLGDLLLSGFQSVYEASLEQMDELARLYELYGMANGKALLEQLRRALLKRKNSFDYDLHDVMLAYSQLEFYISSL